MSALGQKQTCALHKPMSALPLIATVKADIAVPTEGGAFRLCPVPLRNREGIVHINAEISDSALYLGVTKQKPDGAQISDAAVDQCRLEEHAFCKAMSAFTVAIRCKADMPVCTANVR